MANNNVEMAAVQPTGVSNSGSRYDDLEYNPERNKAKEVRNAMLVVAALISAATYAAGINPPGGVWQDDSYNSTSPHSSGKSILGTNNPKAYKVFFFANAAAFSSANLVIAHLLNNFPYYLEIWGAMVCMSLTYGISIGAVSPPGDTFYGRLIWLAIAFPYILRAIAFLWKIWKKSCGSH